jgi:hypothetical protein
MKRIAFVVAMAAMAGCSKGEQKPAETPAADTSKMMMMSDTSKMKMADTSKMMMAPAKPMAPAKKM